MGDRITTLNDCPHCKGKGTFECYEALSSNMKFDECINCGYSVNYIIDDTKDVITITKCEPNIPEAPTAKELE